jgi:hypothetical protein
MFTIITGKAITKVKLRGGKSIDELVGSNMGKVRLILRAAEKKYGKGKKNRSRFRAVTNDLSARNDNRRSEKHRS